MRQRRVHTLDAAVRGFRERLARVRRQIDLLTQAEARRPLTPAEARPLVSLRLESEGLRLELERLRGEFVAVTGRQSERRAGEA